VPYRGMAPVMTDLLNGTVRPRCSTWPPARR
jgi:hypothetical protein